MNKEIKIVTTSGCYYCQAMVEVLLNKGVTPLVVEVKPESDSVGAFPRLYYGEELIFTGLPKITTLLDWVEGYEER